MNKIDEFVMSFPKTKTQTTYRCHLNKYFETIKANPEKYFDGKRDYEQDVKTHWMALIEYAPTTRNMKISTIKQFLEDNDIELSAKFWMKLKRKRRGNRPVTQDVIPTNQQLRKILHHAEIKAKALYLLLSSSGIRISEAIGLLPNDIDLTSDPPKIYVRAEIAKNNVPRICFFSSEAKEVLLEWLKVRDEYLVTAVNRAKTRTKFFHPKDLNDKRVFPFSYTNAQKIWLRLLKNAQLDERDANTQKKYHRMHIHTLRKFFETRMSVAGVPEAIYQQLEGHEGYLNGAYKRYTEQELGEWYKKGMVSLLVFETQPDLSEVHEQLKEKDTQIQDLRNQMEEMRAQIVEMRLEKLENRKEKK